MDNNEKSNNTNFKTVRELYENGLMDSVDWKDLNSVQEVLRSYKCKILDTQRAENLAKSTEKITEFIGQDFNSPICLRTESKMGKETSVISTYVLKPYTCFPDPNLTPFERCIYEEYSVAKTALNKYLTIVSKPLPSCVGTVEKIFCPDVKKDENSSFKECGIEAVSDYNEVMQTMRILYLDIMNKNITDLIPLSEVSLPYKENDVVKENNKEWVEKNLMELPIEDAIDKLYNKLTNEAYSWILEKAKLAREKYNGAKVYLIGLDESDESNLSIMELPIDNPKQLCPSYDFYEETFNDNTITKQEFHTSGEWYYNSTFATEDEFFVDVNKKIENALNLFNNLK